MLKDIRKSMSYTMERLAKESDTSLCTIQNWETIGIEHVTIKNALRVAKALGCALDELIG